MVAEKCRGRFPSRLDFTVRVDAVFDDAHIDIGELKQCLRVIADTQSITHAANALGALPNPLGTSTNL